MRRALALLVCTVLSLGVLAPTRGLAATTATDCAPTHASRWSPAVGRSDPSAPLRVFVIQPKQEARHAVTYATYATEIRCLIDEFVAPHLRADRAELVVFPEDFGLLSFAIGSRGMAARTLAGSAARAPAPRSPIPLGAAAGLTAIESSYTVPAAFYRALFPDAHPRAMPFLAATDTIVRGFAEPLAKAAVEHGITIVASANVAPFTWSQDPADVAALSDPDLAPAYASGELTGVYRATQGRVYNTALVWGPDVRDPDAPPALRNLIAVVRKPYVVPIEADLLGLSAGSMSADNARAIAIPGTAATMGIALGITGMLHGADFGEPSEGDPCATPLTYVRCLDARGADVFVHPMVFPIPWAGSAAGGWTALADMAGGWRAVADPEVSFRHAAVAYLVGNVFDVPMDGQSSILSRGGRGPGEHHVGASALGPDDPPDWWRLTGPKPEFVAHVPWVVPDTDRATLREIAARLAPGSGHDLENDYLETARFADLDVRRAHPDTPPPGRLPV